MNVVPLLAVTISSSELSLSEAAEAVARNENVEAAAARIVRAKQQGLWFIHDRAKKAEGEARSHLFEVIGRFATDEAEWALIQELKSGPIEGKRGAIRGLARANSPSARASLLRHAALVQADLRDAIAESLVSLGVSEKQLRDLAQHESDGAREVALRYLARTEPTPLAFEIGAATLRDPASNVAKQSLALATKLKDASQVYALAEIARAGDAELAEPAVLAMAALEGHAASNELGSVVASESAHENAWRLAAEVLRDRDRGQLAKASARASQERRTAVARIAAIGAEPEHFEPVIDLLDDPSLDIREAAMTMLVHSGAAGRAAAEARLKTPLLPELADSIKKFLATPMTPPEAVSVR